MKFSFSQFGEDLTIARLFQDDFACSKVYLDAGAFHPIIGSNTLLLHKAGWEGINVDLAPKKIENFRRYRPNDHNVTACLSSRREPVKIAHYEQDSNDRVIRADNPSGRSLVGEKPLRYSDLTSRTLNEIIAESRFKSGEISYLNVDCEGEELNILEGLDLELCRPKVLSVETFSAATEKEVARRLASFGYTPYEKLALTSIFVRYE